MAKTHAAMPMEHSGKGTFGDAISRKLWLLDSAALCESARRRTGLQDFGDPPIEPAFSVLVQSLEREADLHPLGRFLMRVHLRELLETRLRLAEEWRGQRERLANSPIQRPIFIIGMPRSGSTFLHELLAEDPDNRVPRVWEVMFPTPAPDPATSARDPRIRKTAACLWWFRRLAPGADSVYPMRAQTPHECVAIQSYTFLSEEFISTCRIPSYEAFLHSADLRPAYEWQKRFLQHLQSRGPAQRWVMKSPDHVYGLAPLMSVFPDAIVIQTHRNPIDVVKSSSQLTEVLRGLYSRRHNGEQIPAREARVLAEGMERLIRFRDQHPEMAHRFIDVNYTELAKDPVAAVRRIYRQLDISMTDVAAERMQRLASTRSRYRKRRAIPTMADLGLDPAAEARRFEHYCSRFNIPLQPAEPSR